MAWAIHVYNEDGASHDQSYVGPFKSHARAQKLADRIQKRIEENGDEIGTLGATLIYLKAPGLAMVDLEENGWFDPTPAEEDE